MTMNVYDFDKTIYYHDSSVDFYKFNLKRSKRIAQLWPSQTKAMIDYKKGNITKTQMKEVFYRYFTLIEDMPARVAEFWAEHRQYIKPWYLEQRRDDDVIISASPEFLLKPICDELNVHLIGSVVDPKTGKHFRMNCYGLEKVSRFQEMYDIHGIESFYSDSYSDDPLAQFAVNSYMVKGDALSEW